MQVFAPKITGGESRADKAAAFQPLYAPANKAALDQVGKDSNGKLTFGGKYVGTECVCINVVGTITEATTARVLLTFPIGIPKGWAQSVGHAATKPSAPKTVPISVDGAAVGAAVIAVDGTVTFTGMDNDLAVDAGKEIALNFDSLVNSGGGDITLSLYVLK